MPELLLVPIHVDALCVSNSDSPLIAPLANFSKMPYACWVKEQPNPRVQPKIVPKKFNTGVPFTSQQILREPAALADYNLNYVAQTIGMHLHWSLPDALTVMRADPDSNNRLRFPHVPNRWLITCKTKANGAWQVESQWVVESDYLYPEQASSIGLTQHSAITFPIIPAEQYERVLTNPPPPGAQKPEDITNPDYNAVYSAPFRYMGRPLALADWKANKPDSSQYLHQFMPDGLTAIGYGDPLFAAVYTNCFSVFGFVHKDADNAVARRYDVLGWYDGSLDCLKLYDALARQKPGANLYEALTSEYKWKVTDPPAEFPAASLYYASVDVDPQLKQNPALAKATQQSGAPPTYTELNVAVGNTGTEALAADVANTLADTKTNRFIIEDQLEALGLRHELGDQTLDLDARFRYARQNKGFQPRTGGTLWSIQLRSTDSSSSQLPDEQPAVPASLAGLLNDLNLAQAEYDGAWQEIDSLRQRVYADWYKFENAFNFKTGNTTVIYINKDNVPGDQRHDDPSQDPTWENLIAGKIKPDNFIGDEDEILPYITEGSLQTLHDYITRAGLIEIGKDAGGKITLTAKSASNNPYIPNQFTFAQSVMLKLQQLSAQLDQYNSSSVLTATKQEFSILRKSAPQFWQPSEPAVLLKGPAVPATPRHGQDGRASEDDTLACQVLSVAALDGGISNQLRNGDSQGTIQAVQAAIENLRPQTITTDTIGFSQQSEEPWHPISLEWEVSLWPELRGMDSNENSARAGKNYQPGFVDTNYEFEENASDLLLKNLPSRFSAGETENVYTGRTTLTSSAHEQLVFNIEQYLMSLTLLDLKTAIIGNNELGDELDYQVDQALINWAKSHFSLTNLPALKDPATITGPDKQAQITQQQNAVADWFRTQHIFRVTVTSTGPKGQPITKYKLVDLSDAKLFPDGWYQGKPVLTGIAPALKLTTFGTLTPDEQAQDPLNTSLSAHKNLGSANVLAQSLGGFNNALLMREQIPQLPVFDLSGMIVAMPPQGNVEPSAEKYKNLTRDVAAAVAGGNTSSPVTDTDFLPIRSGLMKVNKLYLVDTFGQVLDVSPKNILPSDTLTISRNVTPSVKITTEQDATYVYLAPRLTQPARLNFRWLAAEPGALEGPDEPEMNDHPDTSPVCGWLLPNHLDNSLMVYNAQGTALGSILQTAEWEPAPGTVNRLQIDAISNPHLRHLSNYLTNFSRQNRGYWPAFLNALNYSLENIEPTNFAQHDALALLIGRPIAIVRASLSLQLQGRPALNQKWRALMSDMFAGLLDSRLSNEFTSVSFPVRLGEYRLFNDGLLGYWIEDEDGFKDNKFYSTQSEDVNNPNIITHHATAITQNLTVTTDPLKLTMLVDPRGEVHATSAILPAKRISIPPEHYANVLKKLSVTFMTEPLLSEQAGIRLNLPQESGYSWSWLERPSASVWVQNDQIKTTDNTLKFTPQRLVGGWLKLTPEDTKS